MLGCLKPNISLSKRLITEYLTSSRVVIEKPCYLFNSLVSPHASSVDCNALLRNGETVNADILLNLKTQYEQCLHGYAPPIYFNRGLYVELAGELLLLLDDCGDKDLVTNWVATLDALDPVQTSDYVKEGTYSMQCGIDASKNVSDNAMWTRINYLGDLTLYQHDWIYFWLYISPVDYAKHGFEALYFDIGNDLGNRVYFSVAYASISGGWNFIKCDLANPSGSAGAVDWTSITRILFTFDGVGGNIEDYTAYFDSLMVVRPFSGATDGITEGVTVQYLIE